MVPVLFALLSALGYGGSDYAAGIAAREVSVLQLTILSEAAETSVVLLVAPWVSSQGPSAGSVVWAAVAGISGVVGALALYLGFRHDAFNVASDGRDGDGDGAPDRATGGRHAAGVIWGLSAGAGFAPAGSPRCPEPPAQSGSSASSSRPTPACWLSRLSSHRCIRPPRSSLPASCSVSG